MKTARKVAHKATTLAQEPPDAEETKAWKPAPATISVGQSFPICEGAAIVTFTGGAVDGRHRGWICKPDGARVEKIMVGDLAGAEARGQALLDKGAL